MSGEAGRTSGTLISFESFAPVFRCGSGVGIGTGLPICAGSERDHGATNGNVDLGTVEDIGGGQAGTRCTRHGDIARPELWQPIKPANARTAKILRVCDRIVCP